PALAKLVSRDGVEAGWPFLRILHPHRHKAAANPEAEHVARGELARLVRGPLDGPMPRRTLPENALGLAGGDSGARSFGLSLLLLLQFPCGPVRRQKFLGKVPIRGVWLNAPPPRCGNGLRDGLDHLLVRHWAPSSCQLLRLNVSSSPAASLRRSLLQRCREFWSSTAASASANAPDRAGFGVTATDPCVSHSPS